MVWTWLRSRWRSRSSRVWRPRRFRPHFEVETLEERILLASQAYLTPGLAGQTVRVIFQKLPGEADFRNEVGLFRVDDAQGRIGSLRPGDPGYTAAAMSQGSAVRLFQALDRVGTRK